MLKFPKNPSVLYIPLSGNIRASCAFTWNLKKQVSLGWILKINLIIIIIFLLNLGLAAVHVNCDDVCGYKHVVPVLLWTVSLIDLYRNTLWFGLLWSFCLVSSEFRFLVVFAHQVKIPPCVCYSHLAHLTLNDLTFSRGCSYQFTYHLVSGDLFWLTLPPVTMDMQHIASRVCSFPQKSLQTFCFRQMKKSHWSLRNTCS